MSHILFRYYSTIPLLGYLPQEMVGVSIFDFYHHDDLGVLYNIYKQGNFIDCMTSVWESVPQREITWSNQHLNQYETIKHHGRSIELMKEHKKCFFLQSSRKFVGLPDITGKNRLGPVNITASQNRLSDEFFEPKM